MSAPIHPGTPQSEQGKNLKVSVNTIIDQIHARYARQISGLVQENSELAAAQDMLLAENQELRSKLEALMGAPSGTPIDPGTGTTPGGSGQRPSDPH